MGSNQRFKVIHLQCGVDTQLFFFVFNSGKVAETSNYNLEITIGWMLTNTLNLEPDKKWCFYWVTYLEPSHYKTLISLYSAALIQANQLLLLPSNHLQLKPTLWMSNLQHGLSKIALLCFCRLKPVVSFRESIHLSPFGLPLFLQPSYCLSIIVFYRESCLLMMCTKIGQVL